MRKGSPPTTSREPSSAVTNHHQHELSQVANKPIIQPKGTHGMETMLHIYYSLACMAMTCLAIPALPVAIWAYQRRNR